MNLIEQLKRDEGEVLTVYLDSQGIPTAGVGHNLRSHGIDLPVGTPITQDQSDEWLAADVADAQQQLNSHLPWANNLDEVRQAVLINMAFNLGIAGLLGFHRTLTFIENGDFAGAAMAMLQSKWATQVGIRATRLAHQLETGIWN